jgi:hypothetical protein
MNEADRYSAAHNGLVAGSSPAGPTNEINRLSSRFLHPEGRHTGYPKSCCQSEHAAGAFADEEEGAVHVAQCLRWQILESGELRRRQQSHLPDTADASSCCEAARSRRESADVVAGRRIARGAARIPIATPARLTAVTTG